MTYTEKDQEPHPQRWIAMFVLLSALFMNLIDVTIVNVAMPSLQSAFEASSSEIEWVVAAYILVFALGLLPFGRLGDILGRRRIFIAGIVIFTIGSALCGVSNSMTTLIASRVVQGLGGAMMVPQTLALAQVLFPPHERAAAFSLFGLAAGLASVTGPVAGGFLIDLDIYGLDWRPIFLVNIPIGLLATFGAIRFIPALPGTKGLRNDFGGIVLASVTVLFVIYPLIEGRELGWPVWIFVMLVAAIPSALLFYAWERRQAALGGPQLLPVSLLSNRNFVIGIIMVLTLFSGLPGFFFSMALFLQNGNGLTPLQSGLTTMPFSVGVLIASIISGRLGLRWPRRRIMVGAIFLAVCMLWLRFVVGAVEAPLDRLMFTLPLLAGGFGLGVAISPMFQTVLSNVPPQDAGSGSGALQAFQQVGGALGLAITGQIFFSRLTEGFGAGHLPLDSFKHAMTGALLYNTAAFFVIGLLIRLLPKPKQTSPQGAPVPAAEA